MDVAEPQKKRQRRGTGNPKKPKVPRKKRHPTKKKMELKEEVLEEGEIFDPDQFLQQTFDDTERDPVCPVHKEPLTKRMTDGGWEFYFCPHTSEGTICFICTGSAHIDQYVVAVNQQLPAYYYWNMDKMKCYCNESLILSMSKSESNPNRIYLKCRKGKCRFFQWADSVPFGKIKAWLEGKEYVGNEDPLYSRRSGLDSRDEFGYPRRGQDVVDRPQRILDGRPAFKVQHYPPPVKDWIGDLPLDESLVKQCQEQKFWVDGEGKIILPPELAGVKYDSDEEKMLRNQLYLRCISQKQYPNLDH